MRLIDLRDTIERAHASGAPVIVDNTLATPFNQSDRSSSVRIGSYIRPASTSTAIPT
jgi:cystathionine beta-lyase/cystathionine gamma-synthase